MSTEMAMNNTGFFTERAFHRIAVFIMVLSVAFSVAAFVAAYKFVGKPYTGFLFYKNLMVTEILVEQQNSLAPVRSFSDNITHVNGHRVKTADEVYQIIDGLAPGTMVSYTVSRQGESIEAKLPVRKFSLMDFLYAFWIIYMSGLIFFGIGIAVYLLKPALTISKIFLLYCFSIGIWFTSSFDAQSTYVFGNLAFLSGLLYPLAAVFLAINFPSKVELSANKTLGIILVLFTLSLAVFTLHALTFDDYYTWKSMLIWGWLYMFAASLAVPGSSLLTYLKSKSVLEKQRAQIILLGSFLGFAVPAFCVICIIIFRVSIPYNLLSASVIFLLVSIAYAIVKHKLFDIEFIIEKTLTYSLLTGAVGGVFALMVLTFNMAFAKHGGWQNPAFFLILSSFLVLALNPLMGRIQNLVDMMFFRKKYDYRATIEEVSYAMTSLLSLDKIVDKIISVIESTMFSSPIYVAVYDQESGKYEIHSKNADHAGNRPASVNEDNILVQNLNRHGKEIFKEDLIVNEQFIIQSANLAREFERFDAALVVPLMFKKQLIGYILLGVKKSGLSYTSRDIKLLRLLANQSAIAIENALAFKLVEDYAKKLENSNRELQEAHEQLLHAEKMSAIGQLAAGIAHEIRNPLNIIEGARYYLSTYMTSAENQEQVGEYLEYIKHEIERTNRLIDSLLKFSRAEPPLFKKVKINEILESVIMLIRKQLSDSQVKLSTEFDEALPEIRADSNQLWQVFINIMMNAVQAMPEGGNLYITTKYNDGTGVKGGRSVSTSFRDTGLGIRKDEISKIFDPFFTKKDMGTGLGLSIAYKIIEEHKGRIIVNSEVGKGSVFTIELPVDGYDEPEGGENE